MEPGTLVLLLVLCGVLFMHLRSENITKSKKIDELDEKNRVYARKEWLDEKISEEKLEEMYIRQDIIEDIEVAKLGIFPEFLEDVFVYGMSFDKYRTISQIADKAVVERDDVLRSIKLLDAYGLVDGDRDRFLDRRFRKRRSPRAESTAIEGTDSLLEALGLSTSDDGV